MEGGEVMGAFASEIDRNAPLSLGEIICVAILALSAFVGLCACIG